MTLAGIKVGDVVHVDKKGRRFYAVVTDIDGAQDGRRALLILPCCRETYRTCTAHEVIGHYRKAAGSA